METTITDLPTLANQLMPVRTGWSYREALDSARKAKLASGQTWPILALVGLTASGKSGLSYQLAQVLPRIAQQEGWPDFHPEIVGADAFQLYQGMDIGTAKTPVDQRQNLIHWQFDVLDLSEPASVAAYQKFARQDLTAIWGRGSSPIVVGGSGLYLRALLDRISFPGTNPDIRQTLQDELVNLGADGPEIMHQRLSQVDPVSAERLKAADTRRVIRALEVYQATGQPFSATLPDYSYWRPCLQFALDWPMELIDRRIEQRGEEMFNQGLVEEVSELMKRGLAQAPTASRATGYPEVMAYLRGEISKDQAQANLVQATKRLARKQRKWFRRDPRIINLPGQLSDNEQITVICSVLKTWFNQLISS